jgi:transcription initiation factor TFIIB
MSLRDTYDIGFDEETGKTISTDECPECSGRLETEGGEISCSDCGLIVNEYWIDHAAAGRSFPDEEQQTKRTGAPLTETRHDRGLSTEIGYKRDAHGNSSDGSVITRTGHGGRRKHSRTSRTPVERSHG